MKVFVAFALGVTCGASLVFAHIAKLRADRVTRAARLRRAAAMVPRAYPFDFTVWNKKTLADS